MSSSVNGLSDGASGELNPPTASAPPPEHQIGARPAKSAPLKAWVDYVVALGADRTFVTSTTEHVGWRIVEGRPEQVALTEPALSRPQLIELADRLGG